MTSRREAVVVASGEDAPERAGHHPPQHRRVLDAVLGATAEGPGVGGPELRSLAQDVADRLGPALTTTASPVRVDQFRLAEALRCPARTEDDTFVWSVPKATRRLGLRGLSIMHGHRGGRPDAVAAAARAIEEEIDALTSLGRWLSQLPAASKAAALAAASGFAARYWVAVPWRSFDRVQFGPRAVRRALPAPAEAVTLEWRLDAAVFVAGSPERVLVRLGTADAAAMGFDALVASLQQLSAPRRVVAVDAATGQLGHLDVDLVALRAAADRVAKGVAELLSTGGALRAVPGPTCHGCRRLVRCAAGAGWVAAQVRRAGGIPLDALS